MDAQTWILAEFQSGQSQIDSGDDHYVITQLVGSLPAHIDFGAREADYDDDEDEAESSPDVDELAMTGLAGSLPDHLDFGAEEADADDDEDEAESSPDVDELAMTGLAGSLPDYYAFNTEGAEDSNKAFAFLRSLAAEVFSRFLIG